MSDFDKIRLQLTDRAIARCMDQAFDDRDRGAYMTGYSDGVVEALALVEKLIELAIKKALKDRP